MIDLDRDFDMKGWDLPPYRSKEFMDFLFRHNTTLPHFRTLPIYRTAVQRGLIKNDEWVEKKEE